MSSALRNTAELATVHLLSDFRCNLCFALSLTFAFFFFVNVGSFGCRCWNSKYGFRLLTGMFFNQLRNTEKSQINGAHWTAMPNPAPPCHPPPNDLRSIMFFSFHICFPLVLNPKQQSFVFVLLLLSLPFLYLYIVPSHLVEVLQRDSKSVSYALLYFGQLIHPDELFSSSSLRLLLQKGPLKSFFAV